jgi:hypothetical protein
MMIGGAFVALVTTFSFSGTNRPPAIASTAGLRKISL